MQQHGKMRGVQGVHGAIHQGYFVHTYTHTHTENPALMCLSLGNNPQNKEKECWLPGESSHSHLSQHSQVPMREQRAIETLCCWEERLIFSASQIILLFGHKETPCLACWHNNLTTYKNSWGPFHSGRSLWKKNLEQSTRKCHVTWLY